MIKDEIKNPARLGNPDAVVAGTNVSRAIGLHRLIQGQVGLVVSTNANETYFSNDVKAVILTSEKAHALGKALIELSGINEEPTEDKPLHISLEEFRELREGDQVILRDDTNSDEVFRFGYSARFHDEIKGRAPVTITKVDSKDDSIQVVNSNGRYGWFTYKAVKEVIKAPKEHFRVRLSTKIWYAGKGGQITTDKDYAAIMNKPHAENVVKKYGGQLVKVDYSELEDK